MFIGEMNHDEPLDSCHSETLVPPRKAVGPGRAGRVGTFDARSLAASVAVGSASGDIGDQKWVPQNWDAL